MENNDNEIQEEVSSYFASRRPAKILTALLGTGLVVGGAINHSADVAGFGAALLLLSGALYVFDKIAENGFPQAARKGWDQKWDDMERPNGNTQSRNDYPL